jgi:hypothetical protein
MNAINRDQLLALHEQTANKAREVMTKKNHDYATDSDVFRNFRYFGGLGILVRLSDKLARLRSFEENGQFKVTDENLEDTIIDAINYAVIYLAFKRETAPTTKKVEVLSGPWCENCEAVAKFRQDMGKHFRPLYWCESCATAKGVAEDSLTLMSNLRDGF